MTDMTALGNHKVGPVTPVTMICLDEGERDRPLGDSLGQAF